MKKPLCLRAMFSFIALFMLLALSGGAQAKDQTLLDKVIAKKEIRCGYLTWPPATIKDPNTGKISGVFSEILEKAAANAGLKVVWAEEVTYGTAIEGLKTKRYDMVCTSIWPNASRALHASFTTPLNYSVTEAFVRSGETRIKKLEDINDPAVTISTIDGEASETVARSDFPKAKTTGLPAMSDYGQLYNEMMGKKSDVVLHDLTSAREVMVKNPGKIKRLAPGKPLRVYPNSFMVPKGEEEFRDFLNLALEELINSGYVRSVMKKYKMEEGTYHVAPPYAAE
ncbi:MAG: transporter substrate-binding domain-containing protein [Alphaproteobacteria bacterium]|nr:transporter substrate-binding domain-containing protein [Alphaproteobacteria bacterium]